MKDIKAFSFYKSYYEAVKELENEDDKKDILFAIINFVFEGKEPKFTGIKKIIWCLIEPNLSKSKNKSNANAGAPLGNQNAKKNKEETETIKIQSKINQLYQEKSYSYIIYHLSFIKIENNKNKNSIYNLFLEYIILRIDNKYNISETVIKRLIDKLNEYGSNDEEKKEIISQAINSSWKDFYPLNERKDKQVIYETV